MNFIIKKEENSNTFPKNLVYDIKFNNNNNEINLSNYNEINLSNSNNSNNSNNNDLKQTIILNIIYSHFK